MQPEVVSCTVPGTYLVTLDPDAPIPTGKTSADMSVPVHAYRWGWLCTSCPRSPNTTRAECDHVREARAFLDTQPTIH